VGTGDTTQWLDLQEQRVRDARPCTPVPPRNLHGKEGVDGSSPSEASEKPCNGHFCVVCFITRGHKTDTSAVRATHRDAFRSNLPGETRSHRSTKSLQRGCHRCLHWRESDPLFTERGHQDDSVTLHGAGSCRGCGFESRRSHKIPANLHVLLPCQSQTTPASFHPAHIPHGNPAESRSEPRIPGGSAAGRNVRR
jgi:hypothetical protein